MKKLFLGILAVVYSFLSVFHFSFDDGERIWTRDVVYTVQARTDLFCPGEDVWVNGSEYPSIIELSHNGNRNGVLLATFELFDKEMSGFHIMESFDAGDTWTEKSTVTETLDMSIFAAWNPCLFELPEALGEYAEGTVILAGVSIDPTQSRKSQISVYASGDCAEHWKEISVVDTAGGTGDGVWEPYLMYDDGYLYCFYSDDSDAKCSQTIVYRRSADCVNWEEKTAVVVSDDPEDRPGMPVLTQMDNGQYFLCYEFGRDGEYPVYYKTSDSLNEWNSENIGTPVVSRGKKTISSAPSCIWIPEGGQCGTLIVSGKYGNSRDNDLFVSSDYGKTFYTMKNPLPYSDRPGFGYHASFFYSPSKHILYYANAVDYTDRLSKISVARIDPVVRPIAERDKRLWQCG